jgi:hypothetical protein
VGFWLFSFQEEVWKEVGEAGVKEVTCGFTTTIFAYGQTGAGKTFSMFGTDFESEGRVRQSFACFIAIHRER